MPALLLKKISMLKYISIFFLLIYSQSSFADTKETYRQLSIFNEVYNRVKDQYVEEVTDKVPKPLFYLEEAATVVAIIS